MDDIQYLDINFSNLETKGKKWTTAFILIFSMYHAYFTLLSGIMFI